jgi:CubicO group peptidase (beta-lactamase class C family)
MSDEALAGFVKETAEGLGVTGAAVGVWADGREVFASHGVTSVENPLPVRPDTLFLIGRAAADRAAGARASYSQAGFNLAGRIVAKVTGLTYEKAVASLVFDPAGLSGSFFDRDDIMTRRFAVGHNRGEDRTVSIGRLWRRSRGDNPGGGIASSAADMLRWARFHLGSGVPDVLPAGVLRQMREPTTALRGSSLGDAIGIGGSCATWRGARRRARRVGQRPVRRPAPGAGTRLRGRRAVQRGPGRHPVQPGGDPLGAAGLPGITDRDPEPLPFDEARAREVAGRYENEVMTFTVGIDGARPTDGGADQAGDPGGGGQGTAADPAPFEVGLLPRDEYIVTGGEYAGQRGFFTRDASGTITGVDLAGRLATRV